VTVAGQLSAARQRYLVERLRLGVTATNTTTIIINGLCYSLCVPLPAQGDTSAGLATTNIYSDKDYPLMKNYMMITMIITNFSVFYRNPIVYFLKSKIYSRCSPCQTFNFFSTNVCISSKLELYHYPAEYSLLNYLNGQPILYLHVY
jgi:hypothetical protein